MGESIMTRDLSNIPCGGSKKVLVRQEAME